MRDIAVLIILFAAIVYALKSAWWGVIGLAVFSYLNPHTFAWGFSRTLPCYQILLMVVFVSFLKDKNKQPFPNDWRVITFYVLWFYFFLTTLNALVPDSAWPKFIEVSKIYIPFILTLLLINTRKKLYYLIITIAVSIGIVALKGGIFAVMSGFNYRVYGPEGSQFLKTMRLLWLLLW